ncbi:MAG: type IV pilus secretin PilQ [Gammaproteobacteria bacterium]|nr:type IV pilus secretin PilQ [Gammaproteobacteria bacterium]MCP5424663.1 type IV pilus secretin PilQ [Gammaproteobacteria bacterium]
MPPAFLMLLFAMGACFYASSSVAQETVLQAVDIGSLPGNRVQLRFRLSQPLASAPRSFTINEPARVVLDFPNTRNGLSNRQQTINAGVAERINVLEGGDRTRASINLSRLVPYSVRAEGNSVVLTLEAGGRSASTASSASSVGTSPVAKGSISNIDFRRGLQGQGIIGIRLSSPNVNVDVREEGNQIVADFQGVTLARGQEKRLDVTDFATPVSRVDALNENGNARILVQPNGRYEYLAYQADDVYTIEVRPVQEEKPEDTDPRNKKYEGDLLSLNFQDIEVRAVLQIIADFTGLNVVVSDTVQGNLTLRLQNVPWDQALDIIMRTKGLTSRQQGNVIYIAPTEEVAARDKLELEAQKTVEDLVPLRTEIIRVNYAKAVDLKKILEEEGGKDQIQTKLLSPRGAVQVDERTNSLLVKDVPEKIAEIRDLVSRLDIPVRQVMVDSRIVIASDDFRKELGVRWGFTGVQQRDGGVVTTSGSLEGTDAIVSDAVSNLQSTGQAFPVGVPPLAQRLGVNLPVDATGTLALALLGSDYLVDLELSALQAEGRGEILSNPRVVTNDRIEASITQGFEVPYITLDDAGNPNVQFKEANLKLTVTPQITPDDTIIMDLQINKDEPDFGRLVLGQPPINKREIKTQVLVENGETLVLGGVFEQTINKSVDKVPLLGDIPVVGNLFKRNINRDQKLELLIFVTPQIITDGIAAR